MSETEVTTEVQFEDSDDLDVFEAGFFGQKSKVEVKVEPTSSTTEQETSDETDVDTTTQTDEEDEAELQKVVDETPKKKTVQDRIDEVVRQREDIRREAAAEVAKLRQEVEDLKKGLNPVKPVVEAAEPKPDALDKDGNAIYGLGEFDPQYIRDLTRFTLNEERAKADAETAQAQRQTAMQQEQQTLQTSWNTKLSEATKEYPDLTEKGQALLANFNNLDPNYAGYLSTVLMSMDKGPDVLYYLSNHPEEATAIVNSGAQKATLALGRIEARFLQDEQVAPKPRVSKAPPPPPKNVQARGTNGAFIEVAPDTDDLDAFSKAFFTPRKY